MTLIYKIVAEPVWRAAELVFRGAGVDLSDGFIHFSTSGQAPATAARLGDALKWEVSRGGELFPHLYAELPLSAVAWVRPLPLGADGNHDFSGLSP